MSAESFIFHSPAPATLGTVRVADLDTIAAITEEIGTAYKTENSGAVAPNSIDYEVAPDGKVSIITAINHGYDGAWITNKYTLQPVTINQSKRLLESLEPFILAGQGGCILTRLLS